MVFKVWWVRLHVGSLSSLTPQPTANHSHFKQQHKSQVRKSRRNTYISFTRFYVDNHDNDNNICKLWALNNNWAMSKNHQSSNYTVLSATVFARLQTIGWQRSDYFLGSPSLSLFVCLFASAVPSSVWISFKMNKSNIRYDIFILF